MDDNATLVEIGALCTIFICAMTFITFGITIGAFETSLWESNMEIIDYDGQWGEDIVVTYTDGQTESVKQISNSYWSTMAIENEGSKIITSLQYCLNAKIPISDTFDITGYECIVSVVQGDVIFYRITHTYVNSVSIDANGWVRVVTVSLNVHDVTEDLNDGRYTVSFENVGTIEGIDVPDGLPLDIIIEDNLVSFLI